MNETINLASSRTFYRSGVAFAVLTSFLIVWTTIVRDDGAAAGQFMIILAVGVGAFAARAKADGMARTLAGVAALQVILGLLTATAPITAAAPDGVYKAILSNGIGTTLWLVSAASFHMATYEPAEKNLAPKWELSAALVAFGLVACMTGIHIGESDDAPGAGLLGISILAGTIFAAWKIAKRPKEKGR